MEISLMEKFEEEIQAAVSKPMTEWENEFTSREI